jgi:hypothetical protein
MVKRFGKKRFLTKVAVGMIALFALSAALAAPPQIRLQPRPQSQIQTLGQHLDLRAPSPAMDTAQRPASFPSMLHRQAATPQDPSPLPALGSEGMRSRPGLQEFVRRVRREGLPVARLFESKSALVHLGLSPKGKPGLWLVQKTH